MAHKDAYKIGYSMAGRRSASDPLRTRSGPYRTWTDLKLVRRLNFQNGLHRTQYGLCFGLSNSIGPATDPMTVKVRAGALDESARFQN